MSKLRKRFILDKFHTSSKVNKVDAEPGPEADRDSFNEVLADIAVNFGYDLGTGKIEMDDSRAFVNELISLADKFQKIHADTDWEEVDYLLTVDAYTKGIIEGDDYAHTWKKIATKPETNCQADGCDSIHLADLDPTGEFEPTWDDR